MEERTHPVSYALTVARAIWVLSNDAIRDGDLPEAMTSSMVREATDAARSLGIFGSARQHVLPHSAAKAIENARMQLTTLAKLADLVRCFSPAPNNAAHVARAIRDIAEQAVGHLKEADDAMP